MNEPVRDQNVPGDYVVFHDHWIFWNGNHWRWVARNGASSSKHGFDNATDCTLDYRQFSSTVCDAHRIDEEAAP